MKPTTLRVARRLQLPPPSTWFPSGLGIAAGWSGQTVNSTTYNGKTYIGFCDGNGNARVASYDHAAMTWTLSPAVVTGLGADAHATPSVLVRSSDHKILVAVAPHAANHMYVALSTNAEDVTAWGASTDIESSLTGSPTCTYAILFQLSAESGKVYLFYRNGGGTNGQLWYSTSTDGGATWSAAIEVYTAGAVGAYWAISSDDTSRIDFIISDGNAPSGNAASAYHFYYTGGTYYKSDGTHITASLPLGPSDLTKVYDQSNGHVRSPFDIQTNGGNPVAVWAVYDPAGSGSNEHYWYGSCTAGTWTVHEVTDSGTTPDPAIQEGGVAINTTDLTQVFVSKMTSSVWQMFRYATADSGATWSSTQLTSDSSPAPADSFNIRPRSPRNGVAAFTCAWLIGPASSDPSTGANQPSGQIRGYPNPFA